MNDQQKQQYEEVREKLAFIITESHECGDICAGFLDCPVCLEAATQILARKDIAILDKEQKLPSARNAVNKSYNDYMLGQEDMIAAGFRRILPKEE